MARTHYSDYVYYTGTSHPVVGVPITVFLAGTTTPASLFDAVDAPLAQPLITDVTGYFEFYVDDAEYDIYVSGHKASTVAINSVEGNYAPPNEIYAERYATLALADAAAVAAGRQLVISTQFNTVPATLEASVRIITGGKLNNSGALSINGAFEGCDGCFIGAGAVTGLKEARPEWFGAVGDGIADDTTALNNAYIAVSPNGTFLLSAAIYKFISTLPWKYQTNVVGSGRSASVLKKSGNIVGIEIGGLDGNGASGAHFSDFTLDSFITGDTKSGIEFLISNGNTFDRIEVMHQALHGIHIKTGTANAFKTIRTTNNGGDGFRIEGGLGYHSGSTYYDANANTISGLDTISNAGTGFNIVQHLATYSMSNWATGVVSQQNGYGVNIGDLNNVVQAYCESSTGYDFRFDATSTRNTATISHMGSTDKYADLGTDNVVLFNAVYAGLSTPNIYAPFSTGDVAGKSISITAGSAPVGSTSRPGGSLSIVGGDGTSDGGAVHLYGGVGASAPEHGIVHIQEYGGAVNIGKASNTDPSDTIVLNAPTRLKIMTTTQRDAITAYKPGLFIWNSTLNKAQIYDSSVGGWVTITSTP